MKKTSEKSHPPASELVALLRAYVIQETLTPLKSLLRSLVYGLGGAVLTGIGLVIVLLGVLRVLEGETGSTFAGGWSFAPYLFTAVLSLAMIAVAIWIGLRSGRVRRSTTTSHH